MSNNSEDNTNIKVKNLSKDEALKEYNNLFSAEATNILKAYENLDRLLLLLQQAGYTRTAAMTKMANDATKAGIKGFSQRNIYRMLPDEIKSKEEGRPVGPPNLPNGKLASRTIREASSQVQIGKKKVTLPGQLIEMYEHSTAAEPEQSQQQPTGEIVRIEMDWAHCNHFVKWFRQELEQHKDKKDGKYIIEYDIMTKEISVDIES